MMYSTSSNEKVIYLAKNRGFRSRLMFNVKVKTILFSLANQEYIIATGYLHYIIATGYLHSNSLIFPVNI